MSASSSIWRSHWSATGVLNLVLTAGGLALLYSLAAFSSWPAFWFSFGLSLFFFLLILVCSVAVFLVVHRSLSIEGNAKSAVLFITTVLLITGLASLIASSVPGVMHSHLAWSDYLLRNLLFALVAATGLTHYLAMRERWRLQFSAEAKAKLEALQARIRPHFLFNALNTIVNLIHECPERAEAAIMDLSELLRMGLKPVEAHGLSEELDLIQRYLRLEALRLEERLMVHWQLADDLPLGQQLPPLLLQPLVENAIVHGISRRAEGGELSIEGRRIRFARIRFTITNPLPDPDSRPVEGNRTALDNIRQRLALAYEERYGLKTRIEDGHFIAELTIPVT